MKEKEATQNLTEAREQQQAKVFAAKVSRTRPTAAVPMGSPYCSCKRTRVRGPKAAADAAEEETPEKLEAVAAHEAIAAGEDFAPVELKLQQVRPPPTPHPRMCSWWLSISPFRWGGWVSWDFGTLSSPLPILPQPSQTFSPESI